MGWILQVFMIALVGITFLMFSNKFVSSIARVDLNGDDSSDIEGSVTGKLQQGAGLTAGAVAGGIGAGVAGGSIMKGAAVGGFTGKSGGRPGSAALLGMAAGKASSEKTKAKKAEKEHEKKMEEDPVYADRFNTNKENENKRAVKDEDTAMSNASARYDELKQKMEEALDPKKKKEYAKAMEKIAEEWVEWSKHEDNKEEDPKTGKKVPRKIPEPENAELAEIIREKGGNLRPLGKKVKDAVETAANSASIDVPELTSLENLRAHGLAFKGDPGFSTNPVKVREYVEKERGNSSSYSGSSIGLGDISRSRQEDPRGSIMPTPSKKEDSASSGMADAMTQMAMSTTIASQKLQNAAGRLEDQTKKAPSRPPNRPNV